MIEYNIFGKTDAFTFDLNNTLKLVIEAIYKEENLNDDYVVSFILVDNKEIHQINKQYRNIDRPTDVISFATIDGNENRMLSYELGDIYISIDKVKEQAISYGHSVLREFAFLATHGLLHLLGYDHMNEQDEKIMFEKQDLILNLIKINR